jgi:hypothetical protein
MGEEWATNAESSADINSIQVFSTAAKNEELPDPLNYWLPNSYSEAMTCLDIWEKPIAKELAVMDEWNVQDVIDPPTNARLVQTHWTFANKCDGDGNLTSRKARLIVKGFMQIPGGDFFETYTSVVQYELLHMNLALTATKDMEAWQVDYIAAYLNSHPQTITYIKLPDGAKVKGKISRLNKTLYGTMDGCKGCPILVFWSNTFYCIS